MDQPNCVQIKVALSDATASKAIKTFRNVAYWVLAIIAAAWLGVEVVPRVLPVFKAPAPIVQASECSQLSSGEAVTSVAP